MNRSELIRLSIGQIGMVLSYNLLTMNLQDYFQKTAFSSNPNLAWLYAYTVITIAFAAGALSYLFAGWLSDRTYNRFGRRPYLLCAIPGGIVLILLGLNFASLPVAMSFIILSCLATTYAITYRIMYTAYFAMYQDLTKPEDRVKTTVTFGIFGLVGVAGAIILPLFDPKIQADYFTITLICGLAYIATVLFAFFFGPKENLNRTQKQEYISILRSIKLTFQDKNFKNYSLSALFASFTYAMAMFIIKPFIDWKTNSSLGTPESPRFPRVPVIPVNFMIIIVSLLPIALIIFYFCNYASKRWGKRRFYKWALMIGFLTFPFMIFLTNQGNSISLIIQLYMVIVVVLFIVVVILGLQNAILMDITPRGKEATYTAICFFITVIPFPFASELAGVLLSTINYNIGGFWLGTTTGSDFAYGLMIIIMGILLFISYLFLRRVKYEEVMEK